MKSKERNFIFVHSQLDDYGLPAAHFRVYGHLSRRANDGVAWPGIASISRVCRLHPQTVRKALKLLVARGFLRREYRKGDTNLYYLTPPSAWSPPIRISRKVPQTNTAPSNSQGGTAKIIEGHPCENDIAEGVPSEENPPEGNPNQTHSDVTVGVRGIPGSVEEATAVARQLGVDESFAALEYHSKRAVGWKDGYRNPIVSWPDHLMVRWQQEQKKRNERRSMRRPSANRHAAPSRHFDETNYKQSVKDF
jgi:hypothetical protein